MKTKTWHGLKMATVALLMTLTACAPGGKNSLPSSTDTGNPAPQAPADGSAPGAPESSATPVQPEVPNSQQAPKVNRYSAPWESSQTAIVIDTFQGNSIDWNQLATDTRVAGILHRSSIGLEADSKYASRRAIARSRGYLWGAYHLGRSGDPIKQAQFFLKTIGNDPDALMALDLEDTSQSSMMNEANAVRFLDYVYRATGRMPVVYANHSVALALNDRLGRVPLVKKTKLWYARFRSNIPDFPKGIWDTYFLWQFSSEINCHRTGGCLYNVPGTTYDMDVNVFYGTRDQLAAAWKN